MRFEKNMFGEPVCCPVCGNDNLHHQSVEVFWRSTEDSPRGKRVRVSPKETEASEIAPMTGCPSPRRSGLLISMLCEFCDGIVGRLAVFQHKGSTYINWSDP